MTIVEIINVYDHNDLIRINYIPDGKIKIVKSHGPRYPDYLREMEKVDEYYKKHPVTSVQFR